MASKEYIALAASRTLHAYNASWATARGAATGTILTNYDSPFYLHHAGSYLSGGVYHIYRHGMFFDLSNLDANYVIQAATLRLYIYYKGTSGAIHVVEGKQDNPVNTGDYGDLFAAAISGGAQYVTSFVLDQYNDITLNATAIAWLTPGESVVKLALRGGYDIVESEAPGVHQSTIRFHSTQKGTGYEPLLVLTVVAAEYPSDALTRVTGIRHVYRPGFYRLEANLGETSNTIEVARSKVVLPPPETFAREAEFRAYAEAARTIEVPAKTAPELIRALEDEGLFPASAKVTMGEPPPKRIEPRRPTTAPPAAPSREPPPYTYEQQYLIEQEQLRRQQRREVGHKGFIDWRKLTPWVEEKGETLGSEVEERWKSFTGWFGGLFR